MGKESHAKACRILPPVVCFGLLMSVHLWGADMGKKSSDSEGFIDSAVEALGANLTAHEPQLGVWKQEQWRNWPQPAISLPGRGMLLVETPEFLLGSAPHIGPGNLLLSGRSTMAGLVSSVSTPKFKKTDSTHVLEVSCTGGISLTYRATPQPGRIDISCELTNNSPDDLRNVEQFICASVTQDSGYWQRDVLSSHFFSGGKYTSWDSLISDMNRLWKPGMGKRKVGTGYWLPCPAGVSPSQTTLSRPACEATLMPP